MEMKELLRLTEVGFLSSQSTLLDSVSLTLKQNQIVGLLGINGAGKSTTLKICAGILKPSSGVCEYQFAESQKYIGYLPETPPLLANWRVIDFLRHVAKMHLIKSMSLAVESVIEICQLSTILNKQTQQLSKGNQQRLALACAIIHQPKVLLLDEPTSGLDPEQIHNFRSVVKRLSSQCGIIFSSHIMQEAEQLCDKVVIIHQGRSSAEIDVFANQQNVTLVFSREILQSELNGLVGWQSNKGREHYFIFADNSEKEHAIRFCIENQLPLCDVFYPAQQLEKVFLQTIGSKRLA